jgi:F-type H+-transporting ATPase subunit b
MKRILLLGAILGVLCAFAWSQEKPQEKAQEPAVKAAEPQAEPQHEGIKHEAREVESDEKLTHKPSPEEIEKIEKQERKDLIYKTINFVILLGAIIYFLKKPASDFFAARTAAIRKGMADAEAARDAAQKRLGEIEQKMAHLSEEIAALRANAVKEDSAEAEHLRLATAAEEVKILAAADAEIDVKTRQARQELKAYAAKLAVDLAEERLKGRMNAAAQGKLLDSFVEDLTATGGKN